MWISFTDIKGERLGLREMYEVPVIGDSVTLDIGEGKTEVVFKVAARKWVPDAERDDADRKIACIVLLEEAWSA
jgi:hypothetical protein